MSTCTLIPTFEQIPYNSLITRIDNGSQGLFELTNLFNERKELEERNVLHSAKVSRSNVYEYEISNSSGERVLGFFKNYHLFLSKAQVKHHKAFGEVIIKDLEELKINRAANINKHKITVQNCLRDVSNAEDALEKAKKNHTKATIDLERGKVKLVTLEAALVEWQRLNEEKRRENLGKEVSHNKFSMGRMLSAFESTPEQERDKQQRKVDRRLGEVAACVEQILERKRILLEKISLLDGALQKANVAFQESEYERIWRLKICMRNFCELERAAINTRSELLTTLEEAIHSQDAEEDLSLFISQEKHVELTHKYTNAISLMDLYIRKSDEAAAATRAAELAAELQQAREPQSEEDELDCTERDNVSMSDAMAAVQDVKADLDALLAAEQESVVTTKSDTQEVAASSLKSGEGADASQGDQRHVQQMSAVLGALFPASSASTSMRSDLDQSVLVESSVEVSVMGEDEWRELVFCKPSRELLLQELDEQRGRRATLSKSAFATMTNAIKVLLDFCDAQDDAKTAMRATNMANTFHTLDDVAAAESIEQGSHSLVNSAAEEEASDANSSGSSKSMVGPAPVQKVKRYLQTESRLNGHHIWHKTGFWELALQEGIIAQMSLNEPIRWDELSAEGLREAVIGVHNIVFGQLGTLSFAMHDLGLSAEEVEHNVFQMSRRAQLAEDQEHELIRSVRIMYGKEVPPIWQPCELPDESPPPASGGLQEQSVQQQSAPSHHHPVVVVGKVIAVSQSGQPPVESPPLPPPLSPSHIASSSASHSSNFTPSAERARTASFPVTSSTSSEVKRKSLPPEKDTVVGQQQQASTPQRKSSDRDSVESTPIAPVESSFMSFFGRSASTSSKQQLQPGTSKVVPKSGVKPPPPTTRKPSVTAAGAHDDFAVL